MRPFVEAAVIFVCFVAVGAALGGLWWLWWKPAPHGFVYHHGVFLPEQPGNPHDAAFRSTGMYVALAAPAGIVLGVLACWLGRADLRVSVASAVLGGTAAGVVMALVGHFAGPESAAAVARRTADFGKVRGDLRVEPGAAWAVFPAGAALGALMHLLSSNEPVDESGSGRAEEHRDESAGAA